MKGSYVLLFRLKEDKKIQVGRLGVIYFKKGYYAYVGSAMNGLEQRIKRHLREQKKIHWHIDYLLEFSEITDIFYKKNEKKEECDISNKFMSKLDYIPGFGCSDCKCKSHLFYGSKKDILQIISKNYMKSFNNWL